jgi:hypothetical protein
MESIIENAVKGIKSESVMGEMDAIIARINALREQLFSSDLAADEHMEIQDQVDYWRARLALLLHLQD